METFKVKEEHLKLLQGMQIIGCNLNGSWIQRVGVQSLPKIAETIGLEILDGSLNIEQTVICKNLESDMNVALQILVHNCHIEPGIYGKPGPNERWVKISADLPLL